MFIDTLVRHFNYFSDFVRIVCSHKNLSDGSNKIKTTVFLLIIFLSFAIQKNTGFAISEALAADQNSSYHQFVASVPQLNGININELRQIYKNEGKEGVIKYFRSLYPRFIRPTTQNPSSPKPSSSSMPTISPFPTATPSSLPSTTPSPTSTPMGDMGGSGATGGIFGAVSADLLGSCSQEIHDKYVTTGPDGKLYRTWHPLEDPSGCTFAHEHGADPQTSAIYAGAVPFGYTAAVEGMDEPHAGFKCFVQNKGVQNDEGGVALHDAYYCFHMGTGGAGRFTERFHSLDIHVRTQTGVSMHLHGLADTGNVGTICSSPRQGRTVQGLGCRLSSSYEIWLDKLTIRQGDQTFASAIVSTAVFDPITAMDPSDLSRVIYSWSDEAQSQIFNFNNDRNSYRGCDRESYTGPLSWDNSGGSQTYFTDAFGNVRDDGALIQEISTVNTPQAGSLTQYGSLIMAYKGGSDPQSQFKYRQSFCGPGLGLKN